MVGSPWNTATIDEIKGYVPDERYIWWLSIIVFVNLFSVLLTFIGRFATWGGSRMLHLLREGHDKDKAGKLVKAISEDVQPR